MPVFLKNESLKQLLSPGILWRAMVLFSFAALVEAQNDHIRFRQVTIADGLPQNGGEALYEDHKGFLWIGTQSGLSRFDGYNCKVYRHDVEDSNSISEGWINCLQEDRQNRLWVGTGAGLNRLDPEIDGFRHYLTQEKIRRIRCDGQGRIWVLSTTRVFRFDAARDHFDLVLKEETLASPFKEMKQDSQNRWILATDESLFELDSETGSVKLLKNFNVAKGRMVIATFLEDQVNKGVFWIATLQGLARWDSIADTTTWYRSDPDNPKSLPSDMVQTLYEDHAGNMWVGLYGSGLALFDRKTGHFTAHRNRSGDNTSLGGDLVVSLLEHSSGTMWVGLRLGGVSYFENKSGGFIHFPPEPNNPRRLSHGTVVGLAQQKNGDLWIATMGGGLNRYNPKTGIFTVYTNDGTPGCLPSTVVTLVQVDQNDVVWASGHGINRFDARTDRFINYTHAADDPNGVDSLDYYAMLEISPSEMLLGGTLGAVRFDRNSGEFSRTEITTEKGNTSVFALIMDDKGWIWEGHSRGVIRYDPDTDRIVTFKNDPENPQTIAAGMISIIKQDHRGRMWFGTVNGLSMLPDPESTNFRTWRRKQGLPDDAIQSILEDQKGKLWISTNNGLTAFNPETETFQVFDASDGLQSNEFNQGAFLYGHDGIMYFGGVNGFNSFDPDRINESSFMPSIQLTDFLIDNKRARLRAEDPDSPLTRTIDEIGEFTLGYKQNTFSIEFAALDLTVPSRNRYMYMLENFDEDWIQTDAAHRRITYTKLPGGSYRFRVKASNHDGQWNPKSVDVEIEVTPHPLKTRWAMFVYFLMLIGVIALALALQRRKLEREQQQAREAAEQERKISDRLRQVDKLKDQFIANTSHELRTPLNGIIGLAESLMSGVTGKLPKKTIDHLSMIASSGKRLASLVDDLLDFSKVKNRELSLKKEWIDLHLLTNSILTFNRHLIGGKELELVNSVPKGTPPVFADENRITQVLYNLIGNALKFTDQGTIVVSARQNEKELLVSVADTGIGIGEENFERIFETFEQADGSITRGKGGTGLGLAISKKLLELHGGRIWVTSVLDEGSTFFFTLPLKEMEPGAVIKNSGRTTFRPPAILQSEPITLEPDTLTSPMTNASGFRVLIVDDDAINRQVLINYLAEHQYFLCQAANGPEALACVEQGPAFDLVLLDVMMPGMSGYEVCATLRKKFPINELPIIFLTARGQAEDMVQGFHMGANDFLPKPIAKELLLARVKTHLLLLDINRNLEEKVALRTRDLTRTQKELLEAEHLAGMAEIASDVLHSVGNRLNSLGTSLQIIEQSIGDGQSYELLVRISELIEENRSNLAEFISQDPRAERIPEALKRLSASLNRSYTAMKNEAFILREHMNSMTLVLQEQQEHALVQGSLSPTDVNALVDSSLHIVLAGSRSKIRQSLAQDLPMVSLNGSRFARIMLYLLQNAHEAVSDQEDGQIIVRTWSEGLRVLIEIQDNGEGMTPDHLQRAYSHGFTTKNGHHGFGLHYCANAIQELAGTIEIVSPGPGQGTTVTLSFVGIP